MTQRTRSRGAVLPLSPLLAAILVVGCLAGTRDVPPPASQSGTSAVAAPWVTAPPGNGSREEVVHALSQHLILSDDGGQPTVRFFQSSAQKAYAKAECDKRHAGGTPPPDHVWFTVWNRTGLTDHDQYAVDWSGTINHSLTLPPDPPYLLWWGLPCFADVTVQFHASHWLLTGRGFQHPNKSSWNPLIERARPKTEIRVPAGQLTGHAVLPIQGDLLTIEGGPGPGSVNRSGAEYGHLYVYEPNQPTSGGAWIKHVYFRPDDDGWEARYGETGMPGSYGFRANLTLPAAQETVWQVEVEAYRYVPSITDYGFAYPFAFYEKDWARAGGLP